MIRRPLYVRKVYGAYEYMGIGWPVRRQSDRPWMQYAVIAAVFVVILFFSNYH